MSNRTKIVGPVIIGDHCLIEEDSLLIGPAVIGSRCQIKKSVLLRESILWDRSIVGEDSRVENCILETESSISKNTILKNTVVSANGLGPYLPLSFESIPFRVQSKKKVPFFMKHNSTMYEVAKPCMDTFLSLIILILTLPLSLGIALAIKLDSKGSIFFTKKRCGKDGKEFKMVKFRSMIQDAETIQESLRDRNEMDGPMFKIPQDPRLTRVGRLLRKFSLDELPQFLNVLLGDMSIVGPRPLSAEEMKFNPAWRDLRLTVKPGITGLWQVNCRSEGSFKDWIRNDISYVKNRSIWLDLKILLRTIVVVVKSLGAY
jgi:lipopolysaccharide/colanic/teichoic acid biosynthesis glycosyltransferase